MLRTIIKMSNSLRSDSAIFMLNAKSLNLSTFTNLFRLPPPGYTHPASNPSRKLTHQPFEINCRSTTSQPFLKSIHHIISLLSISSPANSAFLFFSVADKGSPRGNSGLRNCERVPPRIFSHLSNDGPRAVPGPATVSKFPLGFFPICQIAGPRAVPGHATVSEFPLGWFSYLPNIKKYNKEK